MRLDAMPHKRLTRPAQVFEFHFQGARKAQGRETMLRLDTVAHGTLNAVAFWFDLHLDEQCTLTSGASWPPRRAACIDTVHMGC